MSATADRDLVPGAVTPDLSVPVPAGSPIRVTFGEYLDVDRLGGAVELRSGEQLFAAQLGYDPVDRAVVVLPEQSLRPRLAYQLTLAADQIVALDGATMAEDLVLNFVTAPASPTDLDPPVAAAEVTRLFARRCGCHGPEDRWPTLSAATLVDVASRRQPGATLVVPGAPMRSHLIERVLPDYPGVRGAQMPPDGPLPDAELRLLVRWVEGL